MTTTEKLEELLHYYRFNRKVGHTNLMKSGTKNTSDCLILALHKKDHTFLEEKPDKIVTWGTLEKLRGHDLPLAIDNDAMYQLLSDTLDEIYELKSKLEIQNRRDSFHI